MKPASLPKSQQSTQSVQDNLEKCKQIFHNEIGSVRSLSRITAIADLFDCLERSDALSQSNFEYLSHISNQFCGETKPSTLDYGWITNDIYNGNLHNVYHEIRISERCKNASVNGRNSKFLPNTFKKTINFEAHKHSIYKLISREIGSYWRSFGRELNISQGVMDSIQVRYPYDLKSQVHKMFEIFEENEFNNSSDHAIMICRALDNCNRKDLRRKIEDIMYH